jgi:hypothetical protein
MDIFTEDRQQIINLPTNTVSFFFFGCWNKNKEATAKIITEINKKNDCQFGIVCGDNVYPETIYDTSGNKTKVANINDIQEGFDILKLFNGQIYIGLGNHEVDSTQPCKSLIDEKINANLNIHMPNNYYSILINGTNGSIIKIIILDTNVLENNKCYGDYNEDVIEQMLTWLQTELGNCATNNIIPIVVGHYPLFYFKNNKNNGKYEFQIEYTMAKINNILIQFKKPIHYLCADIHNYQFFIKDNIHHHIVGTGGAIQDLVIENNLVFQISIDDDIYNVIKLTQKYGYLYVNIENGFLTCQFNSIDTDVAIKDKKNKSVDTKNDLLIGGYEKKYLKYKNKYLKSKKIK